MSSATFKVADLLAYIDRRLSIELEHFRKQCKRHVAGEIDLLSFYSVRERAETIRHELLGYELVLGMASASEDEALVSSKKRAFLAEVDRLFYEATTSCRASLAGVPA